MAAKRKPNEADLIFCEFGSVMIRAARHGAVRLSIGRVLQRCSPSEVLQPSILPVAIKVPAFLSRRLRSNKRQKNKRVNRDGLACAILCELHHWIAASGLRSFHDGGRVFVPVAPAPTLAMQAPHPAFV